MGKQGKRTKINPLLQLHNALEKHRRTFLENITAEVYDYTEGHNYRGAAIKICDPWCPSMKMINSWIANYNEGIRKRKHDEEIEELFTAETFATQLWIAT